MQSTQQIVQNFRSKQQAAEYDKVAEFKTELERLGFSADRTDTGLIDGIGIASGDAARILKGLKNANMTMDILRDTRIGHVVNDIKKQFPNSKEAVDAKALIRQWKIVVENTAPSSSSSSSGSTQSKPSSSSSKSSSSTSKSSSGDGAKAAPAVKSKTSKVQTDNIEKWSAAALTSYLRENNAGCVTGEERNLFFYFLLL